MTVTLRPISEDDLEQLPGGESEFDAFGPRQRRNPPPPPDLDAVYGELAIVEDGLTVGSLSWHSSQWGPGTASRCPEIGIWLAPDHRGRGIGASAQRQVAELFFTHTAVNRVQASTDVANIAEQRALERAGYTREGVARGSQWRLGSYHDMCLYAILRADVSTGEAHDPH